MSSAGHVLDMIKRSRYNDSIRKKRVERMRDLKDVYQEELRKHHHISFRDTEIEKEKLEKIKLNIRKKAIAKQRKAWILTSVATVLTCIAAYYFIIVLMMIL